MLKTIIRKSSIYDVIMLIDLNLPEDVIGLIYDYSNDNVTIDNVKYEGRSSTISLKDYYNNWPLEECKYVQDLKYVNECAVKYLEELEKSVKKGIVLFDFDETIVFGPSYLRGCMELGYIKGQEIFIGLPNNYIVSLMRKIKQMGFKIVVWTLRPNSSKLATIINMNMFDIPYDDLMGFDEDYGFKSTATIAENINNAHEEVVLCIGDQVIDSNHLPFSIKLPCENHNYPLFYM